MYRARRSNERANALSKKHEDVKEQGKVIKEYKTQVLLLKTKIDSTVVQDLQLAPVKLIPSPETILEPGLKLEPELTTDFTSPYNSI
jgi:predicted metal-binding protein